MPKKEKKIPATKIKKSYQVIMQDEWNNLHEIGEYASLDDAIGDLNDFLEPYTDSLCRDVDGEVCTKPFRLEKGDVCEYAGTFGPVFDCCVGEIAVGKGYAEEDVEASELYSVMVRGFIHFVE